MKATTEQKIDPFLLDKTCLACPAQWEGFNREGREVYIRYRWDHFRVYVACEQYPNIWSEEAFHLNEPCILDLPDALNEEMNGWLTTYQMRKLLMKYNLTYPLSLAERLRIEFDGLGDYFIPLYYRCKRFINNRLRLNAE